MATIQDFIKGNRIGFQQIKKDKWRSDREKAINYLYARTKEYTTSDKYYKEFSKKKVPPDNNNVTKRVIDRTSLVYMQPPIRNIGKETDKTIREEYKKLTRGKDLRMHKSEKFLNLLNLIVLHPAPRNNQLEYDIITDFEPRFSDDDPMTPIGISYPLHVNSEVRNTDPIKWAYWDNQVHIIYDGNTNEIIKEMPNKYKILPFLFIFTDKPETYFMDVDPATDLIDMNLTVNVLGTDATLNMRYGAHGQYYGTGFKEETKILLELGADHAWLLPEGSTAGVLTPPDMLQSMSMGIKDKIRVVTNNYHLPQGFIEGDQAQPESGTALRIRNQELTDERIGDIKRWRLVEEELYKIEQIIAKVEFKKKLPDLFSIDYREQEQILTPEEQIEKDTWDLEHNQTTEAKILLRNDPDKYKTLKDAEEEVQKNRNQNKMKAESEKTPADKIFEGLEPSITPKTPEIGNI